MSWEFTNACHLRCTTCLPASGVARPGELTTEQGKRMLSELAERGVTNLLLTGGEPLFRRDFADVLRHAAELGLATAVITSGTLGSRRAVAVVHDAGTRLSVSMDGAREPTHDSVRGKGMFEHAVRGCRRFAEAGILFDLSVTVSRPNVAEIVDMARLGSELGCRRVYFSEVSRGGRAEVNWSTLELTEEQHRELPALVESAARSVFGDETWHSDPSCWVTGESLYVDATGQAYLCAELAQRPLGRPIANLVEPGGVDAALREVDGADHGHRTCLYESFASEHVSLTYVHDRPCAVLALRATRSGAPAGREHVPSV